MPASSHGGGSPFRRLDDAVVPRLQRGARTAVRFLGSPLRGLRRWEGRVADGRPERFLWRHRQELVLAVALILFAGSYVHLQRYPELSASASDGSAAPGPGTAGSPSDGGPGLAGGAVIVGPAQGEQLERYIADQREELADLPDDEIRVAVVSFADYLTAEQVADVVPDGLTPLEIELRLPDEQMDPLEVEVDDDIEGAVTDALAGERERIAEEEAEFQELLESGTVEDEDFVAEFRQQVERLKAVRNLLDTGVGTVFAVVVRGPGGDLQALAQAEQIRLVDPAPAETDPAASTFYGVLPDDEDTASYGGIS